MPINNALKSLARVLDITRYRITHFKTGFMKRILLLTILLVSTISVFAQRGAAPATLRVRLSTNEMLSVSVDDRYYERRGRALTIGNVPMGRHYLKVYNLRVGRSGRGRANLVYSGYMDLKPGSMNNAVVDPFQRRMTMRTTTNIYIRDRNDVYENWDDQNYSRYDDDNNNELRNQEVAELDSRVHDRITDGDKLKMVQTALNGRTYYTDQLRTMVGWLSFESTKLDFLKAAYDNTIDKENYWKLEDVFSFSSSKDELNDFVNARRPQVLNTRDDRDRNWDRDWDGNRDRVNANNYNDQYNPNQVTDQDITDLGARVKDRIGDSDKMKLAQSVMKGREYYTDQLRTVLGWFSFESTKLDFAKWAYKGTVDKENYWKLEDMFSFDSSKNELSDYVQGQRR